MALINIKNKYGAQIQVEQSAYDNIYSKDAKNAWSLVAPTTTSPATTSPTVQAQTSTPALSTSSNTNTWATANTSLNQPIKTSELNNVNTDAINQAKINQDYINKVNETYSKYGADAGANRAFVEGAARAAGVQWDESKYGSLVGSKLSNVVDAFKLGSYLDNFGVSAPVDNTNGSGTVTPDNSNGKTDVQEPQTALDKMDSVVSNYLADKSAVKDKAMQDNNVSVLQESMNKAQEIADSFQTKVEQMQLDLNLQDILNEEAVIALKDKIENNGGQSMVMINRRLTKGINDLSQEQRIDRLYDVYSLNTMINAYNAQIRAVNLAQGQYNQAMKNVQSTVDDWTEMQNLKLQVLEEHGQLEKEDKARAKAEIEFQRNLRLEGYTYIENTDTYNKIVKDLGINAGNFSQFIYKDIDGKMYLKPDTTNTVTSTIQVDGHLWGINSNGDKIKDYGRTSNYSFSTDSDGNVVVTDPATGEVKTQYKPESFSSSIGDLTITGMDGSEYWEHGLDAVLEGGKGAGVKAPFIGEVVFAGENGGFGNQVKIKAADGTEVWLSHLDDIMVEKGDFVNEEMLIGTQGNTGKVYSLSGGDGTHLDITMKKPDGSYYKPREVASILGYNSAGGGSYNKDILTARLGKQIYGTRISDAESKRVESFIKAGLSQGKKEWDIIDDVIGFQIEDENDKTFADNLKSLLLQNTGDSGLAGFDMLGLARLINDGNYDMAITKAENMVYSNAKSIDGDGFVSESTVKSAINKGSELADYVNKLDDSPIGVIEGTMENWLGKFKGKEAATTKAKIVNLVAKMRNDLLGSAVTETEKMFLEPIIPELNDTPANFAAKLEQLMSNPLLELNNYRTTFGLPELDYDTLESRQLRTQLYQMSYKTNNVNNNNDPLGIL